MEKDAGDAAAILWIVLCAWARGAYYLVRVFWRVGEDSED